MPLFAAAFAGYVLALGLPTEQFQAFGWLWAAQLAWMPAGRSSGNGQFVRDWAPLLAVLVLYDYSRGLASHLGTPVHYRPQIRADTALFHVVPTQWLQSHFYDPGRIHWYDVVASFIYFSHFVVTLTTALLLWLTDRGQWARFSRRIIALSVLGLTGYLVFPAAPPWLAAQSGQLAGPVARLSGRGWDAIGLHTAGHALERGQAFANPVAAMPSLHGAFALLVVAFWLPRTRRRWWPLLLSYPVLMGVTLVYTGEHYVVDILAGWLAVGVAFGLASRLEAASRSRWVGPLRQVSFGRLVVAARSLRTVIVGVRVRTSAVTDLLALGFAVMCALVLLRHGPLPTDNWLLSALRGARRPALNSVARDVMRADGFTLVSLLAAGVALLLAVRERSGRPLLVTAGGLLASACAGGLTKLATGRSRPPVLELLPSVSVDGSAFPSLHATQTAAVLVLLVLLVGPYLRTGRRRAVALALVGVGGGAIGLSWLYLGAHWPTDVLGGWLLGGSCALAIWELAGQHRRPPAPSAARCHFHRTDA